MKLGKRYVPVVEVDGETFNLNTFPESHDLASAAAISWLGSFTKDARLVSILEIDLDTLLTVDATDEQRAMHAERMETYWAGERERLWPALQGLPPREQPELPLFAEDDVEWHAWPLVRRGGQHTTCPGYAGVLAVHKPSGVAVVEQSQRSQWSNRQEAVRRLRLLVAADEAVRP